MAWKRTVAGILLSVQLLEDNDPTSLDTHTNPEACDNILALAELAVHKAFVALNVPTVQRRSNQEDAVQEAALYITKFAGHGPRPAYTIGKKRVMSWVIRQLWQGRLRSMKEKEAGLRAPIPFCFSLDGVEGESWIPDTSESEYSLTPEAALLAQEEVDTREVCIEQFYDIAYDLVAYRMGLKRSRHHAALNDTAVFGLTLRGYNYTGVAAGLECTENLAIQRVTYARRRLGAFIEAQGVEVIAAWYQQMLEQDVRAGQRFIAEYVARQEKRYWAQYGADRKRRLREDWKSAARVLWARQRCGSKVGHDDAGGMPGAAD